MSNEHDNQNDDSQNYDDSQGADSQDENGSQDQEERDQDVNDDGCEDEDGPKYVRLNGLPWSATHKEILSFLRNVNVVGGAEGIHLITRRSDGKNTGEAYVEVEGIADVNAAIQLNNASMGHRYIEVAEAKEAMRKTSNVGNSCVVKLRGLPYSVTEQQVEDFFSVLEIKPDREGIVFAMDRRGRATGEAFVKFESQDDTEQALGRNREKIGHRYIEIFRSSIAELKRSVRGSGRMAPYDLKDRGSKRGGGSSDFGGNNRSRGGWGSGGFGSGANNTLGFNKIYGNFGNNGNFGNFVNFGNGRSGGGGSSGNFSGSGGGGGGNFSNNGGNFGNEGGNSGNAGGNFGNNSGGGCGDGFNSFGGNNDSEDFGNFGNNRRNSGNFGNFGNGNFGGGNNTGGSGGFGGSGGGGSGGGCNFGPIGGGRGDDAYIVHMRGLPFNSFENDVFKFFEPVRPSNVRIIYNDKNRHSGTAEACFDTYEDAQRGMKRHMEQMGSRYIELFFNGKSKSGGGPRGGGSGGRNAVGMVGNNYSSGGSSGGGSGGSNSFQRRISRILES